MPEQERAEVKGTGEEGAVWAEKEEALALLGVG